MLGHADLGQTQTYLSTNLDDMRAAVRKPDKIDYYIEFEMIFEETSVG